MAAADYIRHAHQLRPNSTLLSVLKQFMCRLWQDGTNLTLIVPEEQDKSVGLYLTLLGQTLLGAD